MIRVIFLIVGSVLDGEASKSECIFISLIWLETKNHRLIPFSSVAHFTRAMSNGSFQLLVQGFVGSSQMKLFSSILKD